MQSDKITEMLLRRIVFLTDEYFKLKEEVERLKDADRKASNVFREKAKKLKEMDKDRKPSKIVRMRIEK